MPSTFYALVLEPDPLTAADLTGALFLDGLDHRVVATGDEAWRAIAQRRPDLLLISLATPDLDRLHRRLRDEYMGRRPRIVLLATPAMLDRSLASYDVDCVILRPLTPSTLLLPLASGRGCPTLALDIGRAREMLKLSLLGGDLQAALDALANRLVLVYGVSNCAVLAVASERQWVGSVGEPIPTEGWPELWTRVDQAVCAGAVVFAEVTGSDGLPLLETRFAVPIHSQHGEILGALCLFSSSPVLFGNESRDALADLATRLGVELSWRSVHDRLTAERERLRETAMLDPMLGVLGRSALEQALATEIARVESSQAALTVAVIDVVGLRHLNDRYGHVAGDSVLRHVAGVTRRLARAQDVVGRWGDDEIAVVFGATGVPAAAALLERIQRAIESEPVDAGSGESIEVDVSIGITDFRGDDDADHVFGRAARTATGARQKGGVIQIADTASPGTDTQPGLQLARYESGVTLGGMYEIVHEISRGAMGVVYRAEDLGLSRPVALKMLRPDLVSNDELVRRFRAEAAILAKIDHENLVRVYSFVEDRDDVFFVMELVEGVSLDTVIIAANDAGEHLMPERVASICRQIAGALDAMSLAGVMHRDVKPGNVVLDRSRDRAVLVDVGLARKLGDKSEPAGTPGFIAPESFSGDGESESAATDVYGLAATTYAMLSGRAPFGGAADYRDILRRQLEERPPPPSFHRPGLSAAVDQVLLRGLALRARDRFATAGEMAAALSTALGSAGASRAKARPRLQTQLNDEGSRRTLTLDLEIRPPAGQAVLEPMTRGIVFRSVARVLGMRTMAAWLRTIERSSPALAEALSLRTSALAWLPAELFHGLLEPISASGRNPLAFARELGTHAVAQSFHRLFPSSPESLSPSTTLGVLDVLWKRYHTWGHLAAAPIRAGDAEITFVGSINLGACAFIEGWLEQVVTSSGGSDAGVVHTRCIARGDDRCEFAARWSTRSVASG